MTRTPEIEAAAALAQSYNGAGGPGFQNEGRLNAYVCDQCDAYIVTIDREPGVTPFTVGHDRVTSRPCASKFLTSKMYRVAPHLQPTHEWYRPDTLDGLSPNSAEHVRNGGLLLRAIPGATIFQNSRLRRA